LEDAGLTRPFTSAGLSSMSWEILHALVLAAGRFAVPLPLVESIAADWVLGLIGVDRSDGRVTLADPWRCRDLRIEGGEGTKRLWGVATRVPWGRAARYVLIQIGDGPDGILACIETAHCEIAQGHSIAGEPRDTLSFSGVVADVWPLPGRMHKLSLRHLGAALRAAQMAGALATIRDMAVTYAQDRVQFGRPIGKFQAVRHQIADLAAASAAADVAAADAARRLDSDDALFEIAVAKARACEAAAKGSLIAHQVHGALGFAKEHDLHYFTSRLWAWRTEFGSEIHWQDILGNIAAEVSTRGIWPLLTSR
jgi:hypothetical protein